MIPRALLPSFFAFLAVSAIAQETVAAPAGGLDSITKAELMEHVEIFAADEMQGRGPTTEGHTAARKLLIEEFKRLGLKPAGDEGTYEQKCRSERGRRRRRQQPEGEVVAGVNVLGVLPGRDEKLAKEHLIISAHYDHLGVTPDGEIMNGADDNASGMAALLEIAEAIVNLPEDERPGRSILFASWDLEEKGLLGSTHWTKNPTIPLENVVFMTSLDMLSRDFMGVLEDELFVLGGEDSDAVAAAVAATEAEEGMKVIAIGSDLVGSRSDHYPFYLSKVPYLFLSTGTQSAYHQPDDDADTIDADKLTRNTRYIYRLMMNLAVGPRPTFNEKPTRTVAEFENVLHVLDQIRENRDHFEPVEGLFETLDGLRAQVKTIIDSGEVDETQRTQLKLAAGMLVFQLREKGAASPEKHAEEEDF